MFLPLHDRVPRILIARPWITWAIILACVVVFWHEVGGGAAIERLFYGYGLIPASLTGQAELPPVYYRVPAPLTLLTHLFLHGSVMHLLGNMLYLWVFGDNVEDAMGHRRFLLFYLLCGIAAGLTQVAFAPDSRIPTVGASGAISGVLGAYLLLYPRAKVLVPIIVFPVYLPAWLLLIAWFGFQLLAATAPEAAATGVAWWAHVGGFVAGLLLVVPLRYATVPLFGGGQSPAGIRLKRRAAPGEGRDDRHRREGRRRGPWEK